jgi:hypothetical protein
MMTQQNEDKSSALSKEASILPGARAKQTGGRAGLPAGSLPKPYFGPQGDEHRDSPDNAPSDQ